MDDSILNVMITEVDDYRGKRKKVTIDCSQDGRTEQCHKSQCDINNILAKHAKTGLLDHVQRYNGSYEDVSSAEDYHASLNTVMRAEEAFSSLPSDIRNRFKNDPASFLEFVGNPENDDEMYKLGLKVKRPVNEVPTQPTPTEESVGEAVAEA